MLPLYFAPGFGGQLPRNEMEARMADVVVAGCGIVGVSSAIWLQRAGHRVTLVDREGPASGTSHGNAGVLAAGALIPVTTPGLWKKAPGMLFDRDAPLFLRWSYLPRLLPFLRHYMRHATAAHVDHYAQSMVTLLQDTVAQHQSLAEGTGAERFIGTEDYCHGYRTRADFEADAGGWALRKRHGLRFEVLDGVAYAELDPLFDGQFETVVRNLDHGRISDPGAYVTALADHFVAEGGTLTRADISDIHITEGRIAALVTDKGQIAGDHVVLAMGPWSERIARKLGLRIPFESERGYHIELVSPTAMPQAPMMVVAGKFVITPMEGRIRCAGVIEFGGLDAPASHAPFELLRRQFARLLPDIRYDEVREWMGHRPAPADSLPLIGPVDAGGRVHAAFGHQHVGLTGGAKTGRIIADIVSGTKPNIDLAAFDPQRYRA